MSHYLEDLESNLVRDSPKTAELVDTCTPRWVRTLDTDCRLICLCLSHVFSAPLWNRAGRAHDHVPAHGQEPGGAAAPEEELRGGDAGATVSGTNASGWGASQLTSLALGRA